MFSEDNDGSMRGVSMKNLRTAVGLMVVVFAAALARADQVDPTIKTGGPGGGGAVVLLSGAPADIITLDFTIETPSGSSPATSACILRQDGVTTTVPECLFQNDITQNGIGLTLGSLTFAAPGINPSTVTCGFLTGSPFSDCGVGELSSSGGTQVTFYQGTILFHNDFTLDFQDFPPDFSFLAFGATPIPEPATLALLLGGLGAVLVRRRSAAK